MPSIGTDNDFYDLLFWINNDILNFTKQVI